MWLDRNVGQPLLKRWCKLCLQSWGDLELIQALSFLASHPQDRTAGKEAKLPSFPEISLAPKQAQAVLTHSTAYIRYWAVAACRCGLKSLCSDLPTTVPRVCTREKLPHVHSPHCGQGRTTIFLWAAGCSCCCANTNSLSFSFSLPYFRFHLGGFTITGMDFCSPPTPPYPLLNVHMLTLLFPLGFLFAFVLPWRETLEG